MNNNTKNKFRQSSLLRRRADLSVKVPPMSTDLFSVGVLPSPFKPSKSPFPSTLQGFGASFMSPTVNNMFSPRQFLTQEGEFVDRIAALPSPSALKLFPSPLCPDGTVENPEATQNFYQQPDIHPDASPSVKDGKRKVDSFARDNSFGLRTNSDLQRQAVNQLIGQENSENSSARVDTLLSPLKKACLSPISSGHGYGGFLSDHGEHEKTVSSGAKRNAESDLSLVDREFGSASGLGSENPISQNEARINRDRRMRIRAMKALKRSIKLGKHHSNKTSVPLNGESSASFSFHEPAKSKQPGASRKDIKGKTEDEAALSERLLRNREAAFKSRQAAKDKMQVLQKEHSELTSTVGTLRNENSTLKSQVEALTKKVALLSSLAANQSQSGAQRRPLRSPQCQYGLDSPRSAAVPGSQHSALSPRGQLAANSSKGHTLSPRAATMTTKYLS